MNDTPESELDEDDYSEDLGYGYTNHTGGTGNGSMWRDRFGALDVATCPQDGGDVSAQ
jgi:hypothetical protein